jgi:outer membrane lipoprotein-sorting protein
MSGFRKRACGRDIVVQNAGMNRSHLAFVAVAVGCLLRPAPLAAQNVAPPFAMDKQYSADLTIATKSGTTLQSKSYVDGDKMRSDMTVNGMDMSMIVRKDQQKIYEVMTAQKMVMQMPYDPAKIKGGDAASFGPQGNFELIGPESMAGIPCSKYKVTSQKDKEVYFMWLDMAHKVPVAMAAADGAFTVTWKNYKVGPQDPSLFEPPEGFQVVPMPSVPGMPGAGGDGQ